jgi:hypothetical protein
MKGKYLKFCPFYSFKNKDGFVLVGSVAGQRYWSTVLSQESTITTGTWTPDDQQVLANL